MDIKDLLQYKNIPVKKISGDQVAINCPVNNCDEDSTEKEAHFYINVNEGTYFCHKCEAKGGPKELVNILGIPNTNPTNKKYSPFNNERYESQLKEQQEVMNYLVKRRGLTLKTIEKRHLGFGKFYGNNWITIPYFDENGVFKNFYKLRAIEGNNSTSKYVVYPTKSKTMPYGLEQIDKTKQFVMICEGEFDCMVLGQNGQNVISVGAGAQSNIDMILEIIEPFEQVHICFDNDIAGEEGAEKIIKRISIKYPQKKVIKYNIPHEEGVKDVSDLLLQGDEGFYKLMGGNEIAKKPAVMTEQISLEELEKILDITIKEDKVNKLLAFLCFLSMYTERSQFNIIFNGPSSTGKSYIPLEIAKLFPSEDIIDLGKVTNQAFFYEQGEYDQETNSMTIDYSRKTLLFMDQPNTEVISKIRPLLSHDKKVITNKMTDSNLKYGTKTKTAKIVGFCSVIFCTTESLIDEQELTRVILLSPEASPEKIRKVITAKIEAQSSLIDTNAQIESDPNRLKLIDRILDIKYAGIKEIGIPNGKLFAELFNNGKPPTASRLSRDLSRIFSIVHTLALLNYRFRDIAPDGKLLATDQDIHDAFYLWNEVKLSQETGISPHILNFINTVMKDLVKEKTNPQMDTTFVIKREEFIMKYSQTYNTIVDDKSMINKYLRPLCHAGIIEEVKGSDKRENVYALTTSGKNILNMKEGIPTKA